MASSPVARRRNSSGFSLIELLVAITVMVIVMVPMTTVFWRALRTSATTAHRTDAFSVAARETEALHALPYALVGFYTDEGAPQWQSSSTVVIGACSTTCLTPFAPLILPAGTSTPVPGNTGVTYHIARYVYWADAQGVNTNEVSTTFAQAYKADTVVVSWSDAVGSHSVEQDSIIYPGGQGPYTGPGASQATTTTSIPLNAPGTPGLALAVTQPAAPQNQVEVDLAITAPIVGGAVTSYQVQWSTDIAFLAPAQSPQLPPTSTSYSVLGLAAGTLYYLRIFAGNATGQSPYSTVVVATTASVAVTTTVSPMTTTTLPGPTTTSVAPTTTIPTTTTTTLPCNPGGFTITTATAGKTYLSNKGAMSENIILNLTVNGACILPVTASSVLHGTVIADPNSPYALSGAAAGGQWSATILSSGLNTWAVGIHDMTVVVNGRSTAISRGLLVCNWTAPGQRSASSNQC